MGHQGGQLVGDVAVYVLYVVRHVGLPQKEVTWSVRFPGLRKEGPVARGNEPVCDEPSRVAVIRVQPVATPRIMSEEDIRSNTTDHLANRSARLDAGVELAVHDAEERDFASTDQPRGFQ